MFRDFDEGEVLLLDKPLNWTSADLVRKVKFQLRLKKVGHAGTLDPLASGLMILCTGKWTKRIEEFQAQEKEYEGSLVLGEVRPSYDMETEVSERFDISGITEEMIRETAHRLTGIIDQVPPAYSAVKLQGKRAYDLIRAGKEVPLQPKKVTVSAFDITAIRLPEIDFRVVCSKGTYIRSLVRDFGEAMNNGAYMSRLVRTRIGEFKLSDAWTIEGLAQAVKEQQSNEGLPES